LLILGFSLFAKSIALLGKYCYCSLTEIYFRERNFFGGVLCGAGTFDWVVVFPEFTAPNAAGYHSLVYHEALGNVL
jgi:O-acetylhomoserine/O-acetylserine sulfhydrylase-like pyridoxal-dependent enzyme